MEGKNPYLMLDKVLDWFAMDIDEFAMKGERAITRINSVKEIALKDIRLTFKEIDTPEFLVYSDVILDKLVRDGYLTQDRNTFSITFEGKLFSKSGGYGNKLIKDALNLESMTLDLKLRKKNERRLVFATFLAGLGAILLLIWDIWKFYHSCPCK